MVAKEIVQAGETGLAAVAGSVAKAHDSLPENVREAADRKLGAESSLGKGMLSVVDTVVEEAAKAKLAGSAAAAEIAAVRQMDTDELTEKVAAIGEAAKQKVSEVQLPGTEKKSRLPGTKLVLGTVVLGAAAGGAFIAWRRKAAADAQVVEDESWGATPTEDAVGEEQDSEWVADPADDVDEALEMDLGDVPTEVAQAPAPFPAGAESDESDPEHKPEA